MNRARCLVMGIVNRTPDSFYDGGRMSLDGSVAHALGLVEKGADIIDIGAVKAGPGPEVSEQEEMERLLPLLERVTAETEVTVSVETTRSAVARAALERGAAIVNDVSGLADIELAHACAEHSATLVLMHHGGQLRGRPLHPRYADVVEDIAETWRELARRAVAAGVPESNLVVDPGLDFGKNTFHSLEVMRRLEELTAQRWPVLVAPSRKDLVGETLGVEVDDRLEGTLALVALSVLKGAAIVRVHDVAETVHVVTMTEAVLGRVAPAAPVRGLWD